MLKLRLRDLYATKDTDVSLALSHGVNLCWLSEQTGVHESTLLRHYGTFVHTDDADRHELAKIDPTPAAKPSERVAKQSEPVHFGHRLATGELGANFSLTENVPDGI